MIAALIGLASGGGINRLLLTGRLRNSIAVEVAILKDLDPGASRDELQTHVDYKIRLLIAEAEPFNTAERNERRWGLAYIAMAIVLPAALLTENRDHAHFSIWFTLVLLASFGLLGYGISRFIPISREREMRRLRLRLDADAARPDRGFDTRNTRRGKRGS